MVRYLTLIQFTEEGIRHAEDSVQRAQRFAEHVRTAGGNVVGQYWAIGQYDGAVIFEAPDDEVGAGLLLHLAQEGFVKTNTLRVYESSQFLRALER